MTDKEKDDRQRKRWQTKKGMTGETGNSRSLASLRDDSVKEKAKGGRRDS
jgi:hypothetical protein